MAKLFNQQYSLVHPHVLVDKGRRRVARQIYSVFKKTKPKFNFSQATCIDVGAANGIIDKYFLQFVQSIVGVDIDDIAINYGKKHYSNNRLQFQVIQEDKLPFGSNSVDLIIFRRTYGSAEHPERLVREIYRILKPGGLVYFEGNNRFSPFSPRMIPSPGFYRFVYKLLNRETYYLGRYKTYWELEKLFARFIIHHATPHILQTPQNYKFTRLYRWQHLSQLLPLQMYAWFEPFSPVLIWVIEKPFADKKILKQKIAQP